ncbi:uncharacterized protein UBRO_20746 [Ustilago bromivora]|uniref:Uncharacterized protein n=1 Tax=Ustilago bromivora TaxID=307758 RepID=A0A1K0G6P0_9BASI|nr:uncharacterized protein UBRO_20746 [Ustilago bromivora]
MKVYMCLCSITCNTAPAPPGKRNHFLSAAALSWGRMNAQEELESYEATMRSDRGLGQGRVPTELSEIGRIEGSMTELVRISRSKVLLQSSSGSVVPHSYDRSHGNWFEDASITDLTAGGQQARKGSPSDEVGALCDDEHGNHQGSMMKGGCALHLDEVGATPISDEVALALLNPGRSSARRRGYTSVGTTGTVSQATL